MDGEVQGPLRDCDWTLCGFEVGGVVKKPMRRVSGGFRNGAGPSSFNSAALIPGRLFKMAVCTSYPPIDRLNLPDSMVIIGCVFLVYPTVNAREIETPSGEAFAVRCGPSF
jgi:hypothetical protein